MVKIGDYFHPMRGDPRGSLSVGVREANHTFGFKLLSLFFRVESSQLLLH